MYRRNMALRGYLMYLGYVTIQTYDGSVYEGDIVRVEEEYCVVDDISAFGDMVVIYYSDILGVSGISK